MLWFHNDFLTNVDPEYYADIEDVIEVAVFHLNTRERALCIDHLINQYNDGYNTCSPLLADAMELSAKEIHRRLAMMVPANLQVSEFTYAGDDIIIGGILLV